MRVAFSEAVLELGLLPGDVTTTFRFRNDIVVFRFALMFEHRHFFCDLLITSLALVNQHSALIRSAKGFTDPRHSLVHQKMDRKRQKIFDIREAEIVNYLDRIGPGEFRNDSLDLIATLRKNFPGICCPGFLLDRLETQSSRSWCAREQAHYEIEEFGQLQLPKWPSRFVNIGVKRNISVSHSERVLARAPPTDLDSQQLIGLIAHLGESYKVYHTSLIHELAIKLIREDLPGEKAKEGLAIVKEFDDSPRHEVSPEVHHYIRNPITPEFHASLALKLLATRLPDEPVHNTAISTPSRKLKRLRTPYIMAGVANDSQLFEESFTITTLNNEKYDRVARIGGTSGDSQTVMTLDINTDLYPCSVGETVHMMLSNSLALDGSKDDGRGWRDIGGEATLADMYDYVCHGKIYKFEDGEDGQTM